jgi:hypothetical protein
MDEHRFDRLVMTLAAASTRRKMVGRLTALLFAGLLAALLGGDADEAIAQAGVGGRGHHRRKIRRRRRIRRRRDPGEDKRKRNRKKKPKDRCTPDCAGKACGPDGCKGSCAPGCAEPAEVCTAQGQCVPASCTDGVRNGDETDIDCGGSCPPCTSGQACSVHADCEPPAICGGGGTPGVCGATCTPRTCAAAGANCGVIEDGCGGFVDCGPCQSGQACGIGGVPNVCAACELTAECQAAIAAGLAVRCCNGSCVIGNCCTSANCQGAETCVDNTCQA